MKVIDLYLTMERNKNIPKKVVYNYKTYRYYPKYKQYYREEYGDLISLFLEATMYDKVYVIKDILEEDKKIEKYYEFLDTSSNDMKSLRSRVNELTDTLNEIIDKINGKDNGE